MDKDFKIESYDEFIDVRSDLIREMLFYCEQNDIITRKEALEKKAKDKYKCFDLCLFIMKKLNKQTLSLEDLEKLNAREFYKENFETNINNIQSI